MNERVVLFTVGPFWVTAYGLCIALGALLGMLAALLLRGRIRLRLTEALDALLCAAVGALLGARILYCAAMYETISVDFGLAFIPMLWQGGYTLFGGVLGGMLSVALYARLARKPVAALWDALAPGAAVFIAVARLAEYFTTQGLGRYIEEEAFQRFPFAVPDPYGYYAMPVFLYEALAAFTIALVCAALMRRARAGKTAAVFLTLLSLSQILLDSWRQDEYLRFGFVHLNQVAAAAVLAALLCVSVARITKQSGWNPWQAARPLLLLGGLGVVAWVEYALDKSAIENGILYGIMVAALALLGFVLLLDGRRGQKESVPADAPKQS